MCVKAHRRHEGVSHQVLPKSDRQDGQVRLHGRFLARTAPVERSSRQWFGRGLRRPRASGGANQRERVTQGSSSRQSFRAGSGAKQMVLFELTGGTMVSLQCLNWFQLEVFSFPNKRVIALGLEIL